MLTSPSSTRYRLFRVFGVPVYAEPAAILLVAIIMLFYGSQGARGIVAGLFVCIVAFASLLAHELGHAFAVRHFRYGKSEIVMGALGGVCRWNGRPTNGHRIGIALAGPFVSLALGVAAAIALSIAKASGQTLPWGLLVVLNATMFLNLLWAVFNMLPIFPMDGGQVARTLFTMKLPYRKAIRNSLTLSITIAAVLTLAAIAFKLYFVAFLLAWMGFRNWNELQEAAG